MVLGKNHTYIISNYIKLIIVNFIYIFSKLNLIKFQRMDVDGILKEVQKTLNSRMRLDSI